MARLSRICGNCAEVGKDLVEIGENAVQIALCLSKSCQICPKSGQTFGDQVHDDVAQDIATKLKTLSKSAQGRLRCKFDRRRHEFVRSMAKLSRCLSVSPRVRWKLRPHRPRSARILPEFCRVRPDVTTFWTDEVLGKLGSHARTMRLTGPRRRAHENTCKPSGASGGPALPRTPRWGWGAEKTRQESEGGSPKIWPRISELRSGRMSVPAAVAQPTVQVPC